jgi:hypothetical protein
MYQTPILIIAFNRPEKVKILIESLRKVTPNKIYLSVDGPRLGNLNDVENTNAVKELFANIDWSCDIRRLFHDDNLGCSLAPREAFNWFFSNVDSGVILEDDCIPHVDFFKFAEEMLVKYRDNPAILNINGSNLGYRLTNGQSYTFSRYMNMTGWATWADRAKDIDYSIESWKKVQFPLWYLYTILRQNVFDFDINWYKYWKQKFDLTVTKPKITWWDFQWIYHQRSKNKLSVVPAVNLVKNIGFDIEGTHTQEEKNPAANVPTHSLIWPLVHTAKVKADYIYEEQYVKWVWCYHKRLPTMFYIKQFVSRFIGLS